jgi:hypothetical protein
MHTLVEVRPALSRAIKQALLFLLDRPRCGEAARDGMCDRSIVEL